MDQHYHRYIYTPNLYVGLDTPRVSLSIQDHFAECLSDETCKHPVACVMYTCTSTITRLWNQTSRLGRCVPSQTHNEGSMFLAGLHLPKMEGSRGAGHPRLWGKMSVFFLPFFFGGVTTSFQDEEDCTDCTDERPSFSTKLPSASQSCEDHREQRRRRARSMADYWRLGDVTAH